MTTAASPSALNRVSPAPKNAPPLRFQEMEVEAFWANAGRDPGPRLGEGFQQMEIIRGKLCIMNKSIMHIDQRGNY